MRRVIGRASDVAHLERRKAGMWSGPVVVVLSSLRRWIVQRVRSRVRGG